MRKIKSIVRKIDSVDVVLFTAFGLYVTLLITNLIKML